MQNNEEMQQKIMNKLSSYEQQLNQLRQQFRAVDEGMVELSSLDHGLDEVEDSEGKDILAPVGRGIFVNAKLTSKDLIVDVGDKILVRKSIPETKEIIKNQLERLGDLKKELEEKMDEVQEEASLFLEEVQSDSE